MYLPDSGGTKGSRGAGGDIWVVLGIKFVLDSILQRRNTEVRPAIYKHDAKSMGGSEIEARFGTTCALSPLRRLSHGSCQPHAAQLAVILLRVGKSTLK